MKTTFLSLLGAVMERARRITEARGFGCSWFESLRLSGMPPIAGGANTITRVGFASPPSSYLPAAAATYGGMVREVRNPLFLNLRFRFANVDGS